MNLAARMQLALSPGKVGSEDRSSAARDRILRSGFWLARAASNEKTPSAQILQLFPTVATRRATTLNP